MNLFAFPKKRNCPFCFTDFDYRDAPFRCQSPPSICAPQPDTDYTKYWDDTKLQGRVIPNPGRRAEEAKCPSCPHLTRKRICPHCHMDLPRVLAETNPRVIAVIGGADAGKSHYIAVMIHQFQNFLGPKLNVLMQAANGQTIRRYAEEFRNPVYDGKTIIGKTYSGVGAAARVRIPLIFSVTVGTEGLLGGTAIRDATCLVFYDTAGEDMTDDDILSTVNKYIWHADGIILLLDPLQLRKVRNRLPAGVGVPDTMHEAAEVVNRTIRLIRTARGISETSQINTPIAVALSKWDAIAPLVDSQSPMLVPSDHSRGFDREDQMAVSNEVRELICSWDYGALVQQVKLAFREHAFFALSALGCNPHGTDAVPHVLPHRVEDPLVWLLHGQGLVSERRP